MKRLTIPIFPLNGVIVFPKSNLPLNIFEQRYLDMVNYALSKNKLIGMIQVNENNKLYNVGCVGKIQQFEETADGRYLISLKGKNFFSIIKEIPSIKKFRFAKVNLKIINENKLINKNTKKYNRETLLDKYQNYIKIFNLQVDINFVNQINDANLVTFLAMSCPFGVADKQMLLEAFNLHTIAEKLIALFDFYTSLKENVGRLN